MSSQVHILNGDALKEMLQHTHIEGPVWVARECLIEGPVKGDGPAAIWNTRAHYLDAHYGNEGETYLEKVVPEFQGMMNTPEGSDINLWFEEDLFCQANLWFCMYLLEGKFDSCQFFWVRPNPTSGWYGFGGMKPQDLPAQLSERIPLPPHTCKKLTEAWTYFQQHDLAALQSTADQLNPPFGQVQEVVKAHVDRFPTDEKWGKPEQLLVQLIEENPQGSFGEIFRAFNQQAGIYGFGDSQVKKMYDRVNPN
ncbi:DUF1835 domain-containing protein [Pontibacter sp. G13]|uniref:DUF1835 domain-containing protein n=1 Tax=Pontibacter sp. G13 TaxID=3074898 RepID=UPI00288B3ED9|nr:DUF1835 domain-containing protein [Pontibacter sp. G13]WNJ18908.1 DUF1835 domain-containing protein [Pontibacter sp. G13]